MNSFRGSKAKESSERETIGRSGGVILMVALFMPIAMLSIGMVSDVALVFVARKSVQDACDLGTLAGCQELDWDLLADGVVAVREQAGSASAISIAKSNLEDSMNLIKDLHLRAHVVNHFDGEPTVLLDASFTVNTFFLRFLPRYRNGVSIRVFSESSVVERTQW